jgi:hypothetical protein
MGIKVNRTKRRSKGVLPKPLEKEQMLLLEQARPIANEPRIKKTEIMKKPKAIVHVRVSCPVCKNMLFILILSRGIRLKCT